VLSQPLAYLYLSQIPYTGLDLGPIGTVLYWLALIGWSLALAYLILFGAAPLANRRVRDFASRIKTALNARELLPEERQAVPAVAHTDEKPRTEHTFPEPSRGHSSYEGFKSYAHGGALSIEDIVKALSRERHETATEYGSQSRPAVEPVYENVEPIYEHTEPVYENVEPIAAAEVRVVPPHIRGFISALVEGDRTAVFAGLRQHVRGAGAPEQLISSAICLLDDAYRARVDGTLCDENIARLTARLNTPTLEKLIASLATAVDSSYSEGVIGAKLALTRALAVIGA
jgi:hypothetical protein